MNLKFNVSLVSNYISNSQIARVLTESWVKENSYCPNCGRDNIDKYSNNKPVADFFCSFCHEDFELKSKTGKIGKKITDGAYSTMIARINSIDNPNFFFLTYDKTKYLVNNFLIIPKHFFQTEIIEERPPLAATARRAGWIGCNIDLQKIPELGRIFIVKNSVVSDHQNVLETWHKTVFLRDKKPKAKGWTLDVLSCLDHIGADNFTLDEVYKFEAELRAKHPENNFVRDKIRQQLQILRDMNIIEFVSRGRYRKIRS